MSDLPSKPYIGGQAVIEGVMMRSPSSFAVAVRRPDGKIAVREEKWQPLWASWKVLRWPFLRGSLVMIESIMNGYSALKFSAEQATPEEERGKGGSSLTMTLSMLVAIGLFVGLPHQIASWLGLDTKSMAFHLTAGAAKLTLLLGYMAAIARVPEIRRVFQFHGAEHKSIYAYERPPEPAIHEHPYRPAGPRSWGALGLTVEHARSQTRFHPRCGTTFLVVLVAMSILVFAAAFQLVPTVSSTPFVQRIFEIVCKLPLLVPIAGLAYEFQRWSARHADNVVVRAMMLPGVAVQNITTREPTDDQLEVALAALMVALWRENAGLGAPEKASEPQLFDSLADLEEAIASWGEGGLRVAA